MSPENRIAALHTLGIVLARHGDAEEAATYLDEAAEHAERSGLGGWILEVLSVRAEARWLAGDDAGARADLQRVAPWRDAYGPWDAGRVEAWALRLRMGRLAPDRAFPDPYARAFAGDWRGAATAFDEVGCPYDAALALLDAGTEAELREALERFERLGAAAAARRTRQALRELGARQVPTGARRSTRANPAGLTGRQLEVLELLCLGHSNEQIAASLVISVRTVDHHVSSVRAKLDARSRTEAAERARRLGVIGRD